MYINGQAIAPYTEPWEYRIIELNGCKYRLAYGQPIPEGAKVIKEKMEPRSSDCALARYR